MTIVVPGLILPDSFVRNIVVTLEGMGHKAVNVPTAWRQRVQSRLFQKLFIYMELGIPQLEIAAWNRLVRTVAKLQPE